MTEKHNSEVKNFLKDYLDDDSIYILVGMARKKENPDLENNIVRRMVVRGDKIDTKVNEMKAITDIKEDTYRLYISANKRDTEQAYLNMNRDMVTMLRDGENIDRMDKEWITQLQQSSAKDETNFIFDVDNPEIIDDVKQDLKSKTEIHTVRPTVNGYHIVTNPFDYNSVLSKYNNKDLEIRTDGLLFLTIWN